MHQTLTSHQSASKLLTSAKTWLTIGLLSATAMLFSSCNKENGSDADNTVKAVFVFDPNTWLICSAEDFESTVAYLERKQRTFTIAVDGQEVATIVAADIVSLNPDPNKFPTFTASIGKEDFKTFTVTVTTTDIDTSFTIEFPITLMANTTTNVDYSLEANKIAMHDYNMYMFFVKVFEIQDTTTLRFTFDGASTAENSAVYFDFTMDKFEVENYEVKTNVSAIKGLSSVEEYGGLSFNCAQTHWLFQFPIEGFTDEHIRQAKLWKKPKGATDWTLDPDFYMW